MRGRGNPNQEDDEYEEEGPTSVATTNYSNRNSGKDSKSIDKVSAMRSKHSVTEQRRRSKINESFVVVRADSKSIDKVSAMRSKHSVTEQRRRLKINERFQVLRDLIPHSDQKRDTASFLLEVIEYVQFLQEKVQKCEGSYQGWNPEPSKLMPWRNSHWRGHGFVGNVRAVANGSGPGSVFSGKLDEDDNNITPTMQTSAHNPVESDPSRDIPVQPDLRNRGTAQSQNFVSNPLQQPVPDVQSAEYPISSDPLVQPEELIIGGGTISIASTYSEGLLSTLTQALQAASVDLSHANISVQIDVGNRVNRGLVYTSSATTDSLNHGSMHLRDLSSGEDSDPAKKRLKM